MLHLLLIEPQFNAAVMTALVVGDSEKVVDAGDLLKVAFIGAVHAFMRLHGGDEAVLRRRTAELVLHVVVVQKLAEGDRGKPHMGDFVTEFGCNTVRLPMLTERYLNA